MRPDAPAAGAPAQKELVRYQRADGLDLNATLYLPPGYERERDGRLPCLLWAYPREYKSRARARRPAPVSRVFKGFVLPWAYPREHKLQARARCSCAASGFHPRVQRRCGPTCASTSHGRAPGAPPSRFHLRVHSMLRSAELPRR